MGEPATENGAWSFPKFALLRESQHVFRDLSVYTAGVDAAAGVTIGREDAQRVSIQVMKDKRGALDTLVREELGIDPAELGGNAWSAALTSFALFSAGAIFPVVPFFGMQGRWAIAASAAASGVVLCAVGMLTSLFNGRSPWYSAVRQLIFGCLAAAVTYGIGAALGTTLS